MYQLRSALNLLFVFIVTLNQSKAWSQEKEEESMISRRSEFELEKIRDIRTGTIPANAYWDGLLQTKQAKEFYRTTSAARTALSWTERGPNSDVVGPSNGNTRANSAVTAGRIRTIWVDAADQTGKTVWVGGVDGGLWYTTDITATPTNWVVVNDYLSNLAVTDITQDPTNPDIMYFCTGEAYYNADAVAGVGVFKSTDHGVTWSLLSSTTSFTYCTRILCDYLGNVYLGTRGFGLQRSTDGGTSWTNITPSGMDSRICDLEISSRSAAGRLHIVAGIFSTQSYRYTDIPGTVSSSAGWTAPTTAFPSYAMRAEIAVSGSVLYACPVNASYQVPTIYKSINGGATWTATAGQPATGWASGQGWYSLAVGIDPTNSNNVIVGGLDNYKTTNGGSSWTKISNWVGTTGQYVHADQHDIVWYPNATTILFACDGGIHYTADGGTTIRDRNTGLRLKQFYSVAIHPTSTNYFLAGAQDNGTHQLKNAGMGASVEVTGGDGAFVAIDQNQPQYQFGAYVYNQYRRSTDGGNTWSSVNLSSTTGKFICPWDYDDVNNRLYASNSAGTYLRWDNPQTGSTTASIGIAAFNSAGVSTVFVSPYTSNRVFFGTDGGRFVRVDNANLAAPTATNITSASMPAGAYASCINTGTSDQKLIACFSNYGINNLWVSNDGGTTWTAIDGDLPNIPVRWCMFEPNDDTKAIIATETGVWETTLINGSLTAWVPSLNFPSVRTDMLQYRATDGTLAAATHGRGIFTANLPSNFVCNSPSGLASSTISATGATVSWSSVTGANSYTLEYKAATATNWIVASNSLSTTSYTFSGLSGSTVYDWRVLTTCLNGNSNYVGAQFTTLAPVICPGPLDVSTNGTYTGAATIPFNTDVKGTISTGTDIDFYKFTISTSGTATVTLTTLPTNYDLRLISSNGTTILATSASSGTTNESFTNRTFTAGTYYLRVYPKASSNFNATSCYTLKVQLGTATASEEMIPIFSVNDPLKLYPNPATNQLMVGTTDQLNASSYIEILDISGRSIWKKTTTETPIRIDLTRFKSGLYMLKWVTAESQQHSKFIKE